MVQIPSNISFLNFLSFLDFAFFRFSSRIPYSCISYVCVLFFQVIGFFIVSGLITTCSIVFQSIYQNMKRFQSCFLLEFLLKYMHIPYLSQSDLFSENLFLNENS